MVLGPDPRGCAIHPAILIAAGLGCALLWCALPTILIWLCLSVDGLLSRIMS